MNLITALNTLGERVNRWYPFINCGGCCVFAVLVAEELQRRGIETCIIVGADVDEDEEIADLREVEKKAKNNKADWNNNGVFFNHVGIEFRFGDEFYHYDTDGVHPEDVMLGIYRIYGGGITVETAKALAEEADGWNTTFDRKKIPSLRRHIRRYLASTLPLTATN